MAGNKNNGNKKQGKRFNFFNRLLQQEDNGICLDFQRDDSWNKNTFGGQHEDSASDGYGQQENFPEEVLSFQTEWNEVIQMLSCGLDNSDNQAHDSLESNSVIEDILGEYYHTNLESDEATFAQTSSLLQDEFIIEDQNFLRSLEACYAAFPQLLDKHCQAVALTMFLFSLSSFGVDENSSCHPGISDTLRKSLQEMNDDKVCSVLMNSDQQVIPGFLSFAAQHFNHGCRTDKANRRSKVEKTNLGDLSIYGCFRALCSLMLKNKSAADKGEIIVKILRSNHPEMASLAVQAYADALALSFTKIRRSWEKIDNLRYPEITMLNLSHSVFICLEQLLSYAIAAPDEDRETKRRLENSIVALMRSIDHGNELFYLPSLYSQHLLRILHVGSSCVN